MKHWSIKNKRDMRMEYTPIQASIYKIKNIKKQEIISTTSKYTSNRYLSIELDIPIFKKNKDHDNCDLVQKHNYFEPYRHYYVIIIIKITQKSKINC